MQKTFRFLSSKPNWYYSSWESVEKLLLAPDRNTHSGRRIYALLQLLATYGVRIGQAKKLRLQDINWREGSIHFRPSKWGNPLCFPLYPEVADALLAYIRETRGKAPYPEVFLTIWGKLSRTAVSAVPDLSKELLNLGENMLCWRQKKGRSIKPSKLIIKEHHFQIKQMMYSAYD